MPFLDDRLSPLTEKGHPLQVIDRDLRRRKQLDIGQDHVTIENPDTEPYAWITTPLFHGEFNWNRSGIVGDKEKTFVAYLSKGKPMVYKNKSIDYIMKDLKSKGLTWRVISPIVSASESVPLVKVGQTIDHFVPFVAKILSSCFKVESESYQEDVREIGSCFYISKNLLLTCSHVINRKKKKEAIKDTAIFVVDGGKRYWARVVDIDFDLDVALLYCDSVQHSILETKKSEGIKTGEEIVCIGSPYGYDNNVSRGIVSSTDREIRSGSVPYFFMDLAVYPGSSGGPVVDIKDGRAFGMASVIVESVGNYGLNAAIPIDVCLERFKKHLDNGDSNENI